MVELFEKELIETENRSSKGNQFKWRNGDIWYKADYTGYEGLAEYTISNLLRMSSLREEEFLLYELEDIKYKSVVFHGVKSKNFLEPGWQLITLERLFKNVYGQSLNSIIYKTESLENRLNLMVKETERITGLKEFGVYMSKMLTIDALFLNEDRHTHNIAVLLNGNGEFRLCPIFDQGAGLLSDITMDYPLGEDIFKLMDWVKAKTFCDSFYEQLDVAEKLYGSNIRFRFTKKDVADIIDRVPCDSYSNEIKERVKAICFEKMRQMNYLFNAPWGRG
ncbi:MAG: hypothetical protein K6B28_03610 [Lachnospiraceae bacterium]|nr:hypothetical protein [Lachnospiraceae bacterium]